MRRWAIIMLAVWIGVIAAQLHASAAGAPTPQPAPVMTGMDCCPPAKQDCPDSGKPDMGCAADLACMARCTFVQPALSGPALFHSATFVTVDLVNAVATSAPAQRGYPPDRPPKSNFLV
jgi:hypothetical protein